MKKLTNKEREVMEYFWQHGPMFVRELLEHYTEEDYAKRNIFQLVDNYIEDSYKGLVSTFLKEEKLSVAELRELISQVEAYKKTKK